MAMSRFREVAAMLALLAGAGCSDNTSTPPDQPLPFITVKRAWKPGERQALIDSIVSKHSYSFPYAGDISDLAPQIYADTDSVIVMIANPAYTGAPQVMGPVISPAPGAVTGTQFSATWNFVFVKITTINTDTVPADSTFWHMVIWSDPSNSGNYGFVIGFSRTNTFSFNQINATNFDANAGKSGAGAGEFHATTGTLWEDKGSAGKFSSSSEVFPGAFTTVTTGPYLGGQSRAGTAYGKVSNSTFTRIPCTGCGTEAPSSFSVAFDYSLAGLPATEILCVFPSPCTTNVPIMAGSWVAPHRDGRTVSEVISLVTRRRARPAAPR